MADTQKKCSEFGSGTNEIKESAQHAALNDCTKKECITKEYSELSSNIVLCEYGFEPPDKSTKTGCTFKYEILGTACKITSCQQVWNSITKKNSWYCEATSKDWGIDTYKCYKPASSSPSPSPSAT